MKSQLLYGCVLLIAAVVARGQSGNTAASSRQETGEPNHQKALVAEVRQLRIELLDFRIEAQAAKILALQQGLTQIEAQRARLSEEDRVAPQQFASVDTRFQGQTLAPEQQAELEGVKATFLAAQAERSSMERSSLQAREAETSAALRLEQEHLQALKAKLTELTTAQ